MTVFQKGFSLVLTFDFINDINILGKPLKLFGEIIMFLEKIKKKIKKLKKEIFTLSLAIKDKRTPVLAKLMIGVTISYALSPIDLIPDFIPVLGYVDDLIILPIMIFISLNLIPKKVLDDCRKRIDNDIQLNNKLGRYSAITIVLIWILLAGLIIYKILKY